MKIFGLLIALMFVVVSCQTTDQATNSNGPVVQYGQGSDWIASMKNLQKTLSEIEPYLFDSKRFNDPANKTFLTEKIKNLAANSKNVNHDPTLSHRDPTVRFVAANFSSDLQRVEQSFQEGKTGFARYQLMKVTSSCVQCHTRMQQGREFSFKTSESFLKNMPVSDQADFLVASRRFSEAYKLLLESLEKAKQDSPPAWELDKISGMAMQIAVQYERDPKKALAVANTINNNSSIPTYLKEKSLLWQQSIKSWEKEKNKKVNLESLKFLLKNKKSEVEAMRVIPDALALMYSDLSKEKLGEALLLTGESYEVLNSFSPMEIHENYYESCIRNLPNTKIAKRCYSKLESSVYFGYTGSSGVNVPLDIRVWLDGLKKLSE